MVDLSDLSLCFHFLHDIYSDAVLGFCCPSSSRGSIPMKDVKDWFGEGFTISGFKVEPLLPRGAVKFGRKYFRGKALDSAEIGVGNGENSKSICCMMNVHNHYAIDGYVEYADEGMSKVLATLKAKARNRLHSFPVDFVYEDSLEAVKHFSKQLDFVYIDADREPPNPGKDLVAWWTTIRPGGVLALRHHFDAEVTRAASLFSVINGLNFYLGSDDIWWVKSGTWVADKTKEVVM